MTGRRDSTGDREEKQRAVSYRKQAAHDPGRWYRTLRSRYGYDQPVRPDSRSAAIVDGLIDHLRYRLGLTPPPEDWRPVLSRVDESLLSRRVLDLLRENDFLWQEDRRILRAVDACSRVFFHPEAVSPLVSCLSRLSNHRDPVPDRAALDSETLAETETVSARGIAAAILMRLAIHLHDQEMAIPPLLPHLMFRFACDPHPGVRLAVLRQLPDMMRYDTDGIWRLFQAAYPPRDLLLLWPYAEPFLIRQYPDRPEAVRTCLVRIRRTDALLNGTGWGKSLAHAFLTRSICTGTLFRDLCLIGNEAAWQKTVQVLTGALQDVNCRKNAGEGLQYMVAHMGASRHIFSAFPFFFESIGTEHIDIAVQIAYTFVSAFGEIPADAGNVGNPEWFYRWLVRLHEKAPAAARQICADIEWRIGFSSRQRQLWQEEIFRTISRPIRHNGF